MYKTSGLRATKKGGQKQQQHTTIVPINFHFNDCFPHEPILAPVPSWFLPPLGPKKIVRNGFMVNSPTRQLAHSNDRYFHGFQIRAAVVVGKRSSADPTTSVWLDSSARWLLSASWHVGKLTCYRNTCHSFVSATWTSFLSPNQQWPASTFLHLPPSPRRKRHRPLYDSSLTQQTGLQIQSGQKQHHK